MTGMGLGIGFGVMASSGGGGGGGGGPFDPASLFTTEPGGYWDFADTASLRMARDGSGAAPSVVGTDPVGYIPDQSGNGNHISTNDDGKRATLAADGIDTLASVGSLYRQFAAAIAQPFEVAVQFEQLAYAGADTRILGNIVTTALLLQGPASGNVRFWSGSYGATFNPGLNVDCVVDGLFDGANSTSAINGGTMQAATLNGSSMDAIVLAGGGGGPETSIRFKRLLIIGRALTTEERTSLYNFWTA